MPQMLSSVLTLVHLPTIRRMEVMSLKTISNIEIFDNSTSSETRGHLSSYLSKVTVCWKGFKLRLSLNIYSLAYSAGLYNQIIEVIFSRADDFIPLVVKAGFDSIELPMIHG